MAKLAEISLNGFVRRTQNTDVLKAGIKSAGAKLTRKGRSRNWQLMANYDQTQQIIQFINHSGEDSWLWVTKVLRDSRPPASHNELLEIAKRNPNITITQLVSLTDCKLSEARRVLDDLLLDSS